MLFPTGFYWVAVKEFQLQKITGFRCYIGDVRAAHFSKTVAKLGSPSGAILQYKEFRVFAYALGVETVMPRKPSSIRGFPKLGAPFWGCP